MEEFADELPLAQAGDTRSADRTLADAVDSGGKQIFSAVQHALNWPDRAASVIDADGRRAQAPRRQIGTGAGNAQAVLQAAIERQRAQRAEQAERRSTRPQASGRSIRGR